VAVIKLWINHGLFLGVGHGINQPEPVCWNWLRYYSDTMTVHIIKNGKIRSTAKGDSQDDLMQWATAAAKKAGLKHCTFRFVRDPSEEKLGKLTKEIRW
jgi:hypothetical protein